MIINFTADLSYLNFLPFFLYFSFRFSFPQFYLTIWVSRYPPHVLSVFFLNFLYRSTLMLCNWLVNKIEFLIRCAGKKNLKTSNGNLLFYKTLSGAVNTVIITKLPAFFLSELNFFFFKFNTFLMYNIIM